MRILLAFFLIATTALPSHQPADVDGDGLGDAFEQDIIARFAPRFLIGKSDCDAAPSEFERGVVNPRPLAPNGTIYGQVFPSPVGTGLIEVHYYHLWSRDCGRMAHPLDIEHVAVLLRGSSQTARDWKALYWMAAAHQQTSCDSSAAFKASAIGAVDRGPRVWVSTGKHASFLALDHCRRGCGGDSCVDSKALTVLKLVNIGEPGAPMNGSLWTKSSHWDLASKMDAEFTESTIARLDGLGGTQQFLSLSTARPTTQAVILAAGFSLGAIGTANNRTRLSLGDAAGSTGNALRTGTSNVRQSLKTARNRTARWIRTVTAR